MEEKNLKTLMKKNNFSKDEEESFENIMKLAKLQYDGSYDDVKNEIKKQIDKVTKNENK